MVGPGPAPLYLSPCQARFFSTILDFYQCARSALPSSAPFFLCTHTPRHRRRRRRPEKIIRPREDFKRRKAVYASDWTDAYKNKRQTVPAILFLYFACLAPVVSFGTIANQLTNGSMGVVEFLLSCGCSGMVSSARRLPPQNPLSQT